MERTELYAGNTQGERKVKNMTLFDFLKGKEKTETGRNRLDSSSISITSGFAGRGRIIVFTSGKGGVGKTTVSCACASLLCLEARRKVLLIDMDTGLRNADIVSGTQSQIVYTLYDVVTGKVSLENAVAQSIEIPGLFVLAADQSQAKESIEMPVFRDFLFDAAKYFDAVFLDCPAGIEYGFRLATTFADEAIIVTTPEMPALRGGAQVVRLLAEANIAPVNAVLNRFIPALAAKGKIATQEETEMFLECPVIGCIPLDLSVIEASHSGQTLVSFSPRSGAVDAIRAFTGNHFSRINEIPQQRWAKEISLKRTKSGNNIENEASPQDETQCENEATSEENIAETDASEEQTPEEHLDINVDAESNEIMAR